MKKIYPMMLFAAATALLCSCQGMQEAMSKGFSDMGKSMNMSKKSPAVADNNAEKESTERVGIYGELNPTERKYVDRVHRQNARDAAANERLVFGQWKPPATEKK